MVGSRVYVGGLPYGTTARDLERFFKDYGRMRDVLIKNGYGFVELDNYRDADDAVHELNGKKLLGERVTVERARGTPRGRDQWSSRSEHRSHDRYGPPTRTNYRLVVENLSSRVSWQDLKDYMRQAGEVTYADAHKQHRNEGVVEFATYSDLKNAIDKLDDTELNGRRIRLVEDRGSSRRRRSSSSYSRSRSRSRSKQHHSRSRSRSRSKRNSRSRSASPKTTKNERKRSKSRSRSNSRKKATVDRSRSNSRKKSVDDRSRSNSRKKSPARSRSRSHSSRKKSHERSKSRSRSRSAAAKRSRSPEPTKDRSRSRSRSPSKDRSKSRSRSHSADN